MYIALDNPFQPESGSVSNVEVEVNPQKIFDPNGVIEGSNVTQSKKNFNKLVDELNSRGLTEPKDVPRQRTEILQDFGYEGEAGWIDGPEGGEREIVIFDRDKVKVLDEPKKVEVEPEPAPEAKPEEKEVAEPKEAEKEKRPEPALEGVPRVKKEDKTIESVPEPEGEERKDGLREFDTSIYKGFENTIIRVVPGQEKEMAKRVAEAKGVPTRKRHKAKVTLPKPSVPEKGFKKLKSVKERMSAGLKETSEDYDVSKVVLKEKDKIVSTNARYVYIFNTKDQKTDLKDDVYNEDLAAIEFDFPDYKKIIPKKKDQEYKGKANALDMVRNLRIASTIHTQTWRKGESLRPVTLSLNPDKTFGFATEDESGNYGETNVQEGAEVIGYYRAPYLNSLLTLHSRTGETIEIHTSKWGDEEEDSKLLILENDAGDKSYLAPVSTPAEEEAEVEEEIPEELGKPTGRIPVGPKPKLKIPLKQALLIKEKPKRPISKADVIKTIKRLWPELSVRGKATFRKPSVKGWYARKLAEMRLQNPRDFDTAIHELGHHFDRELQWWSTKKGLPHGIPSELILLGKSLYGTKKPDGGYRREGFAEFIRDFITGSPDLQSRVPLLHNWFTTEYLVGKPDEASNIRELEHKITQLMAQSPDENFEAFMASPKKDFSRERIASAVASAEAYHINKALPILRAMQKAQITGITPREDPFMLFTAYSRSASGRVLHAAMSATHNLAGQRTGDGLRQAFDPLAGRGSEIVENWKKYAVARRAKDKYKQGAERVGVSEADADAIIAKYDSEEFRQVTDDVTAWNHRILYQLVEAGVITEEDFDAIEAANPVYLPFMRHFIKGEKAKSIKHSRGVHGAGVHRFSGRSEVEIHDPIDMMILQAEKITQVAMQANVVRSLVKLVDNDKGKYLGKIMSPVPTPSEATTFSAARIKSQLLAITKKHEGDPDKIAEEMTDAWDENLTIFTKVKAPRKKDQEQYIVSAIVDGEQRFLQIDDEGILEAIGLLGRDQYLGGPFGNISRELVSLQRLGATGLNPAFGLIRNLLRDSLTASITADYHYHIPLYSTLVGAFKAIRKTESSQLYHALGLDLSGRIKQDKRLRTRTGRAVTVKSPLKKFWYGGPISGIRDLISFSEIGPRLMEFEGALKHGRAQEGWTEEDALILASAAAKDVTVNFTQAGSVGAKINEVVLFYNAGVQGVNKLGRSLGVFGAMPWQKHQTRGANLLKTAKHGSILTAAAVLAYALNKDKEWWKELPEYEKWNYLHIGLGGKPIARIPLPFEAGALFGSLPVAALDGVDSLNEALMQAFKNASPISVEGGDIQEIFHSVMRNIAALAPIADISANRDWKGNYIFNPRTAMGKELEDQYYPYTTDIAKMIGQHFPVSGWASPAQIDHLLTGYTGGLYRRLASMFQTHTYEKIVEGVKGGDLSVLPIAGTFFTRPGTNRLTDNFYGGLKVLGKRKGSDKATLEEIGRLSAGNSLADKLGDDWDARRKAKSKVEQDRILEGIFDKIRAYNARTNFEQIGSYSVILAATDSEPTEIELGTARRLLAGRKNLSGLLREAAKKRGWNVAPRTSTLKPTNFGNRLGRLKKIKIK
jgi:hypothetical protein